MNEQEFILSLVYRNADGKCASPEEIQLLLSYSFELLKEMQVEESGE